MSKAAKLTAVRKRILDELVCPLKDAATNLVFGKGNPDAKIMFLGEAPGKSEDLQGIPFVGAAGKELDKLLQLIGLTLDDVYIANILKYRPPNNRDPTPEEIRNHTPYLIEQIRIINPRYVCTLGNYSTKFVMSSFSVDGMKKMPGITSLHGEPQEIDIGTLHFTLYPLYHPAAMLYNPKLRPELEMDIRKLGKLLQTKQK